ncbi:uncharacterized protein LOC107318454 [Coturnix japonica]|uniref:uncharacterized protein LOC107318454 n=1 Tax=Coturnix japonica TaxID=93934 RepID=UPI00077752D2|nr:uncharacterized protein LOC107318454 [Coturnix japonica]
MWEFRCLGNYKKALEGYQDWEQPGWEQFGLLRGSKIPSHLVPHQLLLVQDETYLNSATQASGSGVEGASLASQVLSAGCTPRLDVGNWTNLSWYLPVWSAQTERFLSRALEKDLDHPCLSHAVAHRMFLEKLLRCPSFNKPCTGGTWTGSFADGKKMLSGWLVPMESKECGSSSSSGTLFPHRLLMKESVVFQDPFLLQDSGTVREHGERSQPSLHRLIPKHILKAAQTTLILLAM